MSVWDPVAFQLSIDLIALMVGGLVGWLLSDMGERRRSLRLKVERLEDEVRELRIEVRSRSYSRL